MDKLISVDFKASFGFLKKPDINEGVYLTFNTLHKPSLLGILGAIVGLEGFQTKGKLPEYYKKLKNLPIGIQPLQSRQGNYEKVILTYNNSTGYASREEGGNLIVSEQTLIKPSFRCFIGLEDKNPLHQEINTRLEKRLAEYIPYLGKNEFSLWWDNYQEYSWNPFSDKTNFTLKTIFQKPERVVPIVDYDGNSKNEFIYFERLPVQFDEKLLQYQYANFVFTNYLLDKDNHIENTFQLEGHEDNVIQLI